MVRHIIIWNLKEDGFSQAQRLENANMVKEKLESLNGKIHGLVELTVRINNLESSTGDMMLDSTFTDEDALKAYQINPLHQTAAGFVRNVTEGRRCVDFEI